MIPIKIQCGCGQHYAFDAEPVAGQLPVPVNCPTCGADGTAAANEIIAASRPPDPTWAAGSIRVRVSTSEPPTETASVAGLANSIPRKAPHVSPPGQVDRAQAEVEARAKVSWGDPPENVLQFLMIQGFNYEEASALITVLFKERAVEVRSRGIIKILTGLGMIAAGGGAILYLVTMKLIMIKIIGILMAFGLWGLWIAINGAIMVAVPKMQSGDVAEQ